MVKGGLSVGLQGKGGRGYPKLLCTFQTGGFCLRVLLPFDYLMKKKTCAGEITDHKLGPLPALHCAVLLHHTASEESSELSGFTPTNLAAA